MNRFYRLLLRRDLYEVIPQEELMARQQFNLYRIFVFTSAAAGFSTAVQVLVNFGTGSLLSIYLFGLSAVILSLFYAVERREQLRTVYLISLIAGCSVIHVQGYTSGGVLNTGTIYLCAAIMTAYMLLGPRTGRWFTVLAILNVAYFYCISEYTAWTDYSLFASDPSLIHQDAFFTFVMGLFLVAYQSNYLNSTKNVIIQRITEQKDELSRTNLQLSMYTEDLERKNSELDKFASIVSHDLKAPLRAIGNLTGWIEEDAAGTMTPEVMANFELIKQRVARMESLINAILDYSRADRSDAREEQVDVSQLISDTMDFIGQPGHVRLNLPERLPVIRADRTRCNQVFLNLMVNAIRYCDKPTVEITVTGRREGDGWVFSVKDNGPGIDSRYHEKIFAIFQTLHRRDDYESTGVGLAIVKKIVEDEGGSIWVESESGKGADFRFFWPDIRKAKSVNTTYAA
jgi:signal transduction histidine kinase